MSLIIDFKLGWLNAWLGMAPIIITMIIVFIRNKEALKRATDMSVYQGKDKLRVLSSSIVYYATAIYTLGVTLKIGTVWFYVGSIIYILGSVPYIMALLPIEWVTFKTYSAGNMQARTLRRKYS